MSYAARGALRSVKNVAKGYTDIQVKVREATSNDPGPVNIELMRQIASASHYDQQFVEIMIIMEKRLNDDGKNWRHVYKALVLLEYLLLAGSDRILQYARDNFYVVKTLKEFQYRDEIGGTDHGHNVRQKAIKVSELLTNSEALTRERNARRNVDDRVYSSTTTNSSTPGYDSRSGSPLPSSTNDDRYKELIAREEEDVRRAIQESLKTANRSSPIPSNNNNNNNNNRSVTPKHGGTDTLTGGLSEEEQLQRAIELSKRDEEERNRRFGNIRSSPSSSGAATTGNNNDNNKPFTTGQPLIDLLVGDDRPIIAPSLHTGITPTGGGATVTIQPTGATDPFALPQGNPFAMLAAQPTGYSVPSFPTGYPPSQSNTAGPPPLSSMNDPFSTASIMGPTPTTTIPNFPTGLINNNSTTTTTTTTNPFTSMSVHPTGMTIYSNQPTGSSWGGTPMSTTGTMTGSSTNPFTTSSIINSIPNRPSSTPPMVDLDNLGPPNRNPFAMSHHTGNNSIGTTPGGNFNWSNTPEPPKLSLMELAQQQQQQRIIGVNTGNNNTGMIPPFGIQSSVTGMTTTSYNMHVNGGTPQYINGQSTGMIPSSSSSQPPPPFGIQPTRHTDLPMSTTTITTNTNTATTTLTGNMSNNSTNNPFF